MFESQFRRWLERWEDPERVGAAQYLAALERLLDDQGAILERRENDISTPMSAPESAISRASLVDSTKALVDGLQALSPPEVALALHQEAEEYLGRVLEWLTLELQHAEDRDDSKRVAANAMIPEIDAREFLLNRNKSNLKFHLNLED